MFLCPLSLSIYLSPSLWESTHALLAIFCMHTRFDFQPKKQIAALQTQGADTQDGTTTMVTATAQVHCYCFTQSLYAPSPPPSVGV